MTTFDRLAELPIEIDGYELEARDRTFASGFERPSTLITIRGGGEEGLGEDVVYDTLDHIAHRDLGPVHDLTGPATIGELCELVGSLDLFGGTPPIRDFSRGFRRWAYESAALDLALRQAGRPLHEALELEPRPLTFVCSTRLGSAEEPSTSEPVRSRLARYPSLRFKLDPTNDWSDELIEELVAIAAVDVLDLKGYYKGTPVDVDTDAALYAKVAEAWPHAWLEDPDINPETEPVLEPHRGRITFDAPIHGIPDIEELPLRPTMVNVKPSRIGGLKGLCDTYDYCEREGIAMYGGGQTELAVGRGQIQYLASMFHPETPNDTAPGGYNETAPPDGLPDSPLPPTPSRTGFRWGE